MMMGEAVAGLVELVGVDQASQTEQYRLNVVTLRRQSGHPIATRMRSETAVLRGKKSVKHNQVPGGTLTNQLRA